MEKRHYFGCGFAAHETLEPYSKEFNPISERINLLRVDTKPLNIILICIHASTETGEDKGYFLRRMKIYHKSMKNYQQI